MKLLFATTTAASLLFVAGSMAVQQPAASIDAPAVPWTVPWTVEVDPAVSADVVDRVDAAFLAGLEVAPMRCTDAKVVLVDDPDNRSYAGTAGPGTSCEIGLDPQAMADGDWYADYSVYHEVAHLYAMDSHGPLFRAIEAHLLARVGITPHYLTDDEYPDGFTLADGSCYDVCQ